MRLFRPSVQAAINTIIAPTKKAQPNAKVQFTEPAFAAFLVFRDCLGDLSAAHCPLARFFSLCGIPNPRVYADFFTWGLCAPFGGHREKPLYLWRQKMALPPALKHFQANAYLYPLLFDPSSDRSLQKRLSFVLSAIGTNPHSINITGQMIIASIKRGETATGGDLSLEIDPTMFDRAHVNTLLQSLGDTLPVNRP